MIIRRYFKVKRNAQPETFYSRLIVGYREKIKQSPPEDTDIHLVFEATPDSDSQPYAVFHAGDSTAIVAPHSKYRTVDITGRTGTIESAKSQLEVLVGMPLEEAPTMLSQEIIRKEIARHNRYKKSRK